LPKRERFDTLFGEFAYDLRVSLPVTIDLRIPELNIARRTFPTRAIMSVPETAVHEDREMKPADVKVRLSGKIFSMQAISHA
jgi:hypothetical protein